MNTLKKLALLLAIVVLVLAIASSAIAKGNPTFGSGGSGAFKKWCASISGVYDPNKQTCDGVQP